MAEYKSQPNKIGEVTMATIKSYTDLKQSRKLAKILPLESADMGYNGIENRGIRKFRYDDVATTMPNMDSISCWSLAALLNVTSTYCSRLEITLRADKKYNVFAVKDNFVFRSFDKYSEGFDNLVDACYKILIKLNELNLL